MKRWAWLGIACVVAVVVAWRLWPARARVSPSDPGPPPPIETPPPPSPKLLAPLIKAPPGADLGSVNGPAMPALAQELDHALSSVTQAARNCGRVVAALDPAASVRVRSTLVVSGGEGHVEAPVIVEGTIDNATARACIVDTVKSARWKSDGEDRRIKFDAVITVDQMRR